MGARSVRQLGQIVSTVVRNREREGGHSSEPLPSTFFAITLAQRLEIV